MTRSVVEPASAGRGLEDKIADLKGRLAYGWQEVEGLRARKYRSLVAVTPAELEAVLARLRDVRPLPLA
jgi:hypothetical protein